MGYVNDETWQSLYECTFVTVYIQDMVVQTNALLPQGAAGISYVLHPTPGLTLVCIKIVLSHCLRCC